MGINLFEGFVFMFSLCVFYLNLCSVFVVDWPNPSWLRDVDQQSWSFCPLRIECFLEEEVRWIQPVFIEWFLCVGCSEKWRFSGTQPDRSKGNKTGRVRKLGPWDTELSTGPERTSSRWRFGYTGRRRDKLGFHLKTFKLIFVSNVCLLKAYSKDLNFFCLEKRKEFCQLR